MEARRRLNGVGRRLTGAWSAHLLVRRKRHVLRPHQVVAVPSSSLLLLFLLASRMCANTASMIKLRSLVVPVNSCLRHESRSLGGIRRSHALLLFFLFLFVRVFIGIVNQGSLRLVLRSALLASRTHAARDSPCAPATLRRWTSSWRRGSAFSWHSSSYLHLCS